MIRIRIAPAHFDFNASAFAWAVLSAAGILLVDFDALRVFRFLGYIEGVRNRAVFASKRHYDPEFEAFRLARDWDRGIYPEGTARQLCAVLASGSRAVGLAKLAVPTLVIHGRDDILIEPSGGMRTAELVAGSVFALMSDMGHDYPRPIWPTLVDLLITHQDRAGHGGPG